VAENTHTEGDFLECFQRWSYQTYVLYFRDILFTTKRKLLLVCVSY